MNDSELKQIAGTLRQDTMAEAARLAREIGVKCIIETGTFRGIDGDGQSTRILAVLANELHADFYTVDINSEHEKRAKEKLKSLGIENVKHALCDSVSFLSQFQSPIQLLYLDSHDCDLKNQGPSQIHQCAEIGAAFGKLAAKAIVLLDDCGIDGGGKGLLSTRFLMTRGYKLKMSAYQNLLVNF